MPAAHKMYVATETFSTHIDGEDKLVVKDKTRVRDDDPRYVANPDYFRELEDYPDIEQATAAPGERRGRGQTAKA